MSDVSDSRRPYFRKGCEIYYELVSGEISCLAEARSQTVADSIVEVLNRHAECVANRRCSPNRRED